MKENNGNVNGELGSKFDEVLKGGKGEVKRHHKEYNDKIDK